MADSAHMRLIIGFFLLSALLSAPVAQTAQTAPTRVFFSGHSLTDQPMPDFLARIAGSLGSPVEWNRQYMVGSAIKHRQRGRGNEAGWAGYMQGDNREGRGMDVVAELRRRPYDVLVITEQHGLIDSLVWHDTVRHLRHYHERFIAGNPDGRTYFYEPWLGIPGKTEVSRWIAYERAASPLWQCIATRVNRSLAAEARRDRIASLPAGLALAELIERATTGTGVPGISGSSVAQTVDRFFHDSVHLTSLGAYYVALVVYAVVFERSPDGAWAPEGVAPAQALALQRVAAEVVARYRSTGRPLTPEDCRQAFRGRFVGEYLAHMRDDYWAKQDVDAARLIWRRWRNEWTIRWRLWRQDPLHWDLGDETSYWFPAP
jgi:hypothetical protein